MLFQRLALLAVAVILASGCQEITRLSNDNFPPKPANAPIEVISVAPTDKPYTEVALVSDSSDFSSRDALLESLRNQARQVGADAIIFKGFQNVQNVSTITTLNPVDGKPMYVPQTNNSTTAEGIAIKWK